MSSRTTSDSISSGSFVNLKLTAEKLAKEQGSVKTDLEMATAKLMKPMEHIHALYEKLQNAIDENAKLKVKQKEDVKLWKGLESKFSSTKALCDQLTEALQQLAGQVRDAERDRNIFEDKLNASSDEKQLLELKSVKEEKEKTFMDEYNRTCKLIEEKDLLIKHLKGAVAADNVRLECLTSRLEEVQHELCVKEDICQHLRFTQENLEKENHSLESINNYYANCLLQSDQELKGLEDSLHRLVEKSVELDSHSLVLSNHVIRLNSAFDTCYKLLQKEKDLIVKWAQCQFDQIYDLFLHVTSENSEFRSEKEELNKKVIELQKDQKLLMVQNAEECRITGEKIWGLESESQTLILKKAALGLQVTKLDENIEHLSGTQKLPENKTQDLMLRNSTLESEKHEIKDQSQVTIQGKSKEIKIFKKEIVRHEELVDSLEKQASQLRVILGEKEQLQLQFMNREKQLEDQRTEILASLAVAENTLTEVKKQYNLMMESKRMELRKHLKEISQNDQADKLVGEMETTCEQKVAEGKEESRQEEHASLVEHNTTVVGACLDEKWRAFLKQMDVCFYGHKQRCLG